MFVHLVSNIENLCSAGPYSARIWLSVNDANNGSYFKWLTISLYQQSSSFTITDMVSYRKTTPNEILYMPAPVLQKIVKPCARAAGFTFDKVSKARIKSQYSIGSPVNAGSSG